MKKVTLADAMTTKGFSKAFAKMADYSLETGMEGGMTCYAYGESFSYRAVYGGCTKVGEQFSRTRSDEYCDAHGLPKEYAMFDKINFIELASLHTHPIEIGSNPELSMMMSRGDLDAAATSDALPDKKPHLTAFGVVIVPSKSRAESMLWKPKAEYSMEVLDVIDEELAESDVSEQASILGKYGKADKISFVKRNGIWHPEAADVKKLEKYEFDV